jgi:hypothetical protein
MDGKRFGTWFCVLGLLVGSGCAGPFQRQRSQNWNDLPRSAVLTPTQAAETIGPVAGENADDPGLAGRRAEYPAADTRLGEADDFGEEVVAPKRWRFSSILKRPRWLGGGDTNSDELTQTGPKKARTGAFGIFRKPVQTDQVAAMPRAERSAGGQQGSTRREILPTLGAGLSLSTAEGDGGRLVAAEADDLVQRPLTQARQEEFDSPLDTSLARNEFRRMPLSHKKLRTPSKVLPPRDFDPDQDPKLSGRPRYGMPSPGDPVRMDPEPVTPNPQTATEPNEATAEATEAVDPVAPQAADEPKPVDEPPPAAPTEAKPEEPAPPPVPDPVASEPKPESLPAPPRPEAPTAPAQPVPQPDPAPTPPAPETSRPSDLPEPPPAGNVPPADPVPNPTADLGLPPVHDEEVVTPPAPEEPVAPAADPIPTRTADADSQVSATTVRGSDEVANVGRPAPATGLPAHLFPPTYRGVDSEAEASAEAAEPVSRPRPMLLRIADRIRGK